SGLPYDGVEDHVSTFLVAESEGALVATAGLEMGEGSALMRSVAVRSPMRGSGLGIEIVRQVLRLAQASGAHTVYLLTTTAGGFFPRFGFTPALRAEIDAQFPDSFETRPGGCCASAEALVLRDLTKALTPHPRSS